MHLGEIVTFVETMPGGEVAVIIGAITGSFAALGGLIAVIVNALVNARTQTMQADLNSLRGVFEVQQQSNSATIQGLQGQISYLQSQLKSQTQENQLLHNADNASRQENGQLRGELETVRRDNQSLRGRVEQQDQIISEQARQIVALQGENADLRGQLAAVKKQTGALKAE